MKPLNRALLAMAVSWIALAPSTGFAQVGWLNPEGKPGVQFEFSAATFEKSTWYTMYAYTHRFKFPTSSMFLTSRFRMSENNQVIVELPLFYTKSELSYYSYGEVSMSDSKFGVANPYIGIEIGKEGTSALFDLGVRLPIISEDNMGWAIPSQYISSHRFLAYLHKVMQISCSSGFRYVDPSGIGIRVTGGGQFAAPSQGGDAELFGDLVTSLWYQGKVVRVGTGLSSLVLITESNIDFTNRLLTTFNATADFAAGNWSPGLHVQMPIGENLTDEVGIIYGLHLSYFFPVTED
jgi:hypothetical protein